MIYSEVCQYFDGDTKTSATISLNQQTINWSQQLELD